MTDPLVDADLLAVDLPVPVVVTDLSGTVLVWNDAATDLYGWEAEEAVGRNVGELTVPPGKAEEASLIMDRVVSAGGWRGPFPVATKDGSIVDVSVAHMSVRVDGEVVGILGVSMPAGPSQWQLLVDHATDALSVHDPDGTYRYASPGYGELLGIDPVELVGVDPYTLFHPDDLDEVRDAHATGLTGPFTVQHRMRRVDGTYRWVETTGRGIPEQHAIVVVARPVPDRLSLMQGLEQQRQVAEHLARLRRERTRFLTTVAHRARHPITIVHGVAELFESVLQRGDSKQLEQVLGDLLPRLRSNAQKLSDLIEQVTHADLLNRDSMALRSRPVQLERLVVEVVQDLLAADAPVTVEVDGGLTVFGDPGQIGLAISAVVHNAVEHTPLHTPIWIRAEQTQTDHAVVITVADAGPGVTDDQKSAIFEQFGRADDSDPDPSLGLGLHIVAEILALHGGRAWVEDRPGGGAAFKLRFPAAPAGSRHVVDESVEPRG